MISRKMAYEIIKRLKEMPVIILKGSYRSGKTTLLMNAIPALLGEPVKHFNLDDPDVRGQLEHSAAAIIAGTAERILIFDEAQKCPEVLQAIRTHLQESTAKRFIIAVSAETRFFTRTKAILAGRSTTLTLRPFSFAEAVDTAGDCNLVRILRQLVAGNTVAPDQLTPPPEATRQTGRMGVMDQMRQWGGLPEVWLAASDTERQARLADYRQTYLERILRETQSRVSIANMVRFLENAALQSGAVLSASRMAEAGRISVTGAFNYLKLLEATHMAQRLPAWQERGDKRLVKSPKLYFTDVGLCRWVSRESLTGRVGDPMYETFIYGELAQAVAEAGSWYSLHHYRTAAGLAVDFIIRLPSGTLLPVQARNRIKPGRRDSSALKRFLREHPAAPFGLVVHPGCEIRLLSEKVWAIPDWLLFA